MNPHRTAYNKAYREVQDIKQQIAKEFDALRDEWRSALKRETEVVTLLFGEFEADWNNFFTKGLPRTLSEEEFDEHVTIEYRESTSEVFVIISDIEFRVIEDSVPPQSPFVLRESYMKRDRIGDTKLILTFSIH